jgi:hypothetical protein
MGHVKMLLGVELGQRLGDALLYRCRAAKSAPLSASYPRSPIRRR